MTDHLTPRDFVDETRLPKPIKGVSTSTAAFVGFTRRGPLARTKEPGALDSLAAFEKIYGGLADLLFPPKTNYLAHAAKAFFEEGGRRLYVARVRNPTAAAPEAAKDWQDAFDALAALEDVSLVAAPGSTERGPLADSIQAQLIAHVAAPGSYRFAVLDIPQGVAPAAAGEYRRKFESKSAAFYYPWVTVGNPGMPATLNLPPSAFLCGIYARVDIERGVFKAPANEVVRGAVGLERQIAKPDQDALTGAGVNFLRFSEGRGFRTWGARTASDDAEWKYANIRRYRLYLEQSLDRGTDWAVFEPTGEALWKSLRSHVEDFLLKEWGRGALLGTKPEHAFFVRCDRSTMTQADLDNGRLICVIGVALVRPAEFVIFRIGQWTADRP